jgi:hypothetical protein
MVCLKMFLTVIPNEVRNPSRIQTAEGFLTSFGMTMFCLFPQTVQFVSLNPLFARFTPGE